MTSKEHLTLLNNDLQRSQARTNLRRNRELLGANGGGGWGLRGGGGGGGGGV